MRRKKPKKRKRRLRSQLTQLFLRSLGCKSRVQVAPKKHRLNQNQLPKPKKRKPNNHQIKLHLSNHSNQNHKNLNRKKMNRLRSRSPSHPLLKKTKLKRKSQIQTRFGLSLPRQLSQPKSMKLSIQQSPYKKRNRRQNSRKRKSLFKINHNRHQLNR